jgi:hypothetical protein
MTPAPTSVLSNPPQPPSTISRPPQRAPAPSGLHPPPPPSFPNQTRAGMLAFGLEHPATRPPHLHCPHLCLHHHLPRANMRRRRQVAHTTTTPALSPPPPLATYVKGPPPAPPNICWVVFLPQSHPRMHATARSRFLRRFDHLFFFLVVTNCHFHATTNVMGPARPHRVLPVHQLSTTTLSHPNTGKINSKIIVDLLVKIIHTNI